MAEILKPCLSLSAAYHRLNDAKSGSENYDVSEDTRVTIRTETLSTAGQRDGYSSTGTDLQICCEMYNTSDAFDALKNEFEELLKVLGIANILENEQAPEKTSVSVFTKADSTDTMSVSGHRLNQVCIHV